MGLMPTCEGALSLKLNLTQVLDGFSGIEHALTAAPLGHDVVELVARSRTSYTATLSIGNGGPPAQDYFIVRDRPRDDPKLNRFAPSYVVDVKMQQRMWREESEYLFPSIAAGVAGIRRAGGLIAMGSHGETPGLGFHWEMQAHAMGGMTPAEVLRAATLGSAEAIGRQQEFGSIEAGKYADLVILEADPLRDIGSALAIEQVMKNGRLYDADTMDEIWPRQLPLAPRWFWNDDLPMSSSGQSQQVERLIRP
jgi:imidazolonepropionase-like amidohydrolase